MDEKTKKALQELLQILIDNPSLPDRITITFKPAKLMQSDPSKDE